MENPRIDIIGAALADPSRARMLCELMDGRAFTAKELACAAEISPQTASAHLRQLAGAGLIAVVKSGRHKYHRIAGAEVAGALEALARLSPTDHLYRGGSGGDALMARSCYNHIAGRLGVAMAARLEAAGVICSVEGGYAAGPRAEAFLREAGLPPGLLGAGGAKPCLDWSERRMHLAGPFATAFMARALETGWLERRVGSRALGVTEGGWAAFESLMGLTRETAGG